MPLYCLVFVYGTSTRYSRALRQFFYFTCLDSSSSECYKHSPTLIQVISLERSGYLIHTMYPSYSLFRDLVSHILNSTATSKSHINTHVTQT